MSLGVAPLQTSQKRDPAGSPFVAGSARNGCSVDGSGRIVLGNDAADAAMPAQFLNDREIVTNTFKLRLIDFLPTNVLLELSEMRLKIENQLNLDFVTMFVLPGGTCQINAQTNTVGADSIISCSNAAGSSISAQTNGADPYVELQNAAETFRKLLTAAGVLVLKSAAGLGNGIEIDPAINDVKSTGTISTADPGGGSGLWQLGKFTAGAVALDPNNYVETMIDGVVRKVLVAV